MLQIPLAQVKGGIASSLTDANLKELNVLDAQSLKIDSPADSQPLTWTDFLDRYSHSISLAPTPSRLKRARH